MDGLEPIKLRVKIDYLNDGGKTVYHPSVGYRFLNWEASNIVKKYCLENGASFDEIKNLVMEKDFRNSQRPVDKLKFVRTLIFYKDGVPKTRVYNFINKEILDFSSSDEDYL